MDSGWAVVLGAVIALTGSAIVPWIREALSDRRRRAADARERLVVAIVDLVGVNSRMATAILSESKEAVSAAVESRQRAAALLLLETPSAEQHHIGALLNEGLPYPDSKGKLVQGTLFKTYALQEVLVAWASGNVPAERTIARFRELTARPNKS